MKNFNVYVFVAVSRRLNAQKMVGIINVNVHLDNAQKKSDILWNNGVQSNGQEKTFYSSVNIPRAYILQNTYNEGGEAGKGREAERMGEREGAARNINTR